MRAVEQKIAREGAISFRDFMETCLYHPEEGYYTSAKNLPGVEGDYLTSPHISPLFGMLLAEQFIEVGEHTGNVHVVEAGAGDGRFAVNVLRRFSERGIEGRYTIVEPLENLRKVQEENLGGYNVEWVESMEELEGVKGCIFSNELIDAMPVHLVEAAGKGLKEVFVTLKSGNFKEVLREAGGELADYFKGIGVSLWKQRAEVNLDALEWLSLASGALECGCIITVDYGYPARELYSRKNGTLMCYSRHRVSTSPYHSPGAQDITAHVNFSALKLKGEKLGLHCAGYTDMASFLIGCGAEKLMQEILQREGYSSYIKKLQPLKSLLMPGGMGTKFKVLVQGKDFVHRIRGLSRKPFIREELCGEG